MADVSGNATASPERLCAELLAALEATDGRRRRRKRDQTPDTIGIEIKRSLLERAVRERPAAEAFEEWLVAQCLAAPAAGHAVGSVRAMAIDILQEWRLVQASPELADWLSRGAPSEDRVDGVG
ncbi:MAG TPA: hypothetical protein VMR23_16210 [Candidatus Limnocylindria bacterium]|nr:hypothetical protein [Candidatus Limnocylindria bacterium]